ncbi:MAG: 2-polyprenylphenol 6-hydroxylase [Proteobacteria bacterium]|nr:2-polyprenylphenol 6-hydroxylase [Pseudomonadota bacterium]MCH8321931.1 2-polyprenylphenol 6-hydroxylase [Pseudomonadota bacterium]
MSGFKNASRFLKVGWILARFDALYFLKGKRTRLTALHICIRVLLALVPVRRDLKSLAPGERLAKALQHLGPAYIKLGQTFATRADLIGEEAAGHLRLLQDRLPSVPTEEIIAAIEDDQGQKIDQLFSHFDPVPAAAASIAQVHFAVTPDGREVAVKVLRPGIEEAMRRDIESFFWLAGVFERYMRRARRLRPVEIVRTLSETVKAELDLRMEASAASELKDNMAGEKGYRVPTMDWSRTSRRVLTMDRVYGTPIYQIKDKKLAREISRTVLRVFLTQALRDGFFHADLHQGNFFVEADGTLVPVDFGIMGRLDKKSRRYLAEILWGFHTRNYSHVADIHFEAGYVGADQSRAAFAQAMRALVEPIMDQPLNQVSFGNLLMQLFQTTEKFSMQTQPQLLTLQRSMMMVEGLALSLDQDINVWEVSRPVVAHWVKRQAGGSGTFSDLFELIKAFLALVPGFLEIIKDFLEGLVKRPAPPGKPAA